jgi:hypothetical protein
MSRENVEIMARVLREFLATRRRTAVSYQVDEFSRPTARDQALSVAQLDRRALRLRFFMLE